MIGMALLQGWGGASFNLPALWCATESQVGPIFWLFLAVFGLQGLKNDQKVC